MELLGDKAQVEVRSSPNGDSANLDEMHGLRRIYHRLIGDEAQVKARFVPFGDGANLAARLVHGLR
jgi:hypothetical protein